MSAITVGGDLVHYEVLGRGGKAVILLHGWLGSWSYWIPIMRQLQLKYRVYGLDWFGYGDSSKNVEKLAIAHQVVLLEEFMRQIDIPKAAIIAHGLGAHVLIEFAKKRPERVARMLIVSAPLFNPGHLDKRVAADHTNMSVTPSVSHPIASSRPAAGSRKPLASKTTSQQNETPHPSHQDVTLVRRPEGLEALIPSAAAPSADVTVSSANNATIANPNMIDRAKLQEAAQAKGVATPNAQPQEEVTHHYSASLYDALNADIENLLLRCFKRSDPPYETLQTAITKSNEDVLQAVSGEFDPGRILDILQLLDIPTVVVHGKDDLIIPAPEEPVWDYLTRDERERTLLPVPLPGVGHFPMIEYEPFFRLVGNFLETPDMSKIELKERWQRRTR